MLEGNYLFNKGKSVVYQVIKTNITEDLTKAPIWKRTIIISKSRFDGIIVWSKKHPKSTYKIGGIRKRLKLLDHEELSYEDRAYIRDDKINKILD